MAFVPLACFGNLPIVVVRFYWYLAPENAEFYTLQTIDPSVVFA
ncbi:MAG: hypothetical protein ACFFAN_05525 [Promethearchaeota archaeon]